jgi:hypothetical protein
MVKDDLVPLVEFQVKLDFYRSFARVPGFFCLFRNFRLILNIQTPGQLWPVRVDWFRFPS